jgi:alpha-glucosidase
MFKKYLVVLALVMITYGVAFGQDYSIFSPNHNIAIEVKVNDSISLDVLYKGQLVLADVQMGLVFNGLKKFENIKSVAITNKNVVRKEIIDPVPVKFSHSYFEYNEMNITLNPGLIWRLKVSNDGFAYSWQTRFKGDVEVDNEVLRFRLASRDQCFFPREDHLMSHYERSYIKDEVDSISAGEFCSLPVLFQKENQLNILVTEADLSDYPAMFVEKSSREATFNAIFPKVILEEIPSPKRPDRDIVVKKNAHYIASTSGRRNYPWRVFAMAENDSSLLLNNMVYALSSPLKLDDISWIIPGKVAWDWWNDLNIIGVDFKSGINNDTYKYYIDFASKFGLEYIILDEGWSKSTTHIMACRKEIDVKALVDYGKEKNVGIILWTLWGPLDKNLDKALSLYESWGVKGVKVDFMQRADQYMVNFYERVAREAAKHHLLVDFHGAFKPAGLRRAFPNVVNYEGVKGQENVKWSKEMTPEHNLTIPFIRMFAGPMDYTPGAMDNAHEQNFAIRWHRPMSMGTRCHQVAMYVVYDAPLQMLCDNPSNYYREQETTEFISQIPTIWDETKILQAKVGGYILLARRNGKTWYLGGMTVDAQEFQVDLSFLGKGKYQMTYMQDGVNSDKNAQDYKKGDQEVDHSSSIAVQMNSGGGFAAIFKISK